jgi:hypothetical protein
MRRTILLVGVAILLVIGVQVFKPSSLTTETSVTPSEQKLEEKEAVSVSVDFGGGEVSQAKTSYINGQTAYGVLQTLVEQEGFSIETEQYDFGVFVKEMNGRASSGEKAWIYFVNGESGNVSADNYLLEPGDAVEWKYIEPTF